MAKLCERLLTLANSNRTEAGHCRAGEELRKAACQAASQAYTVAAEMVAEALSPHCEVNGVRFTDADLINREEFIAAGDYNPHKIHGFVLHDAGFVLAVVFASCLQDALDEAADSGKLDGFAVDMTNESERADYLVKDVVNPGGDPKCPDYVDPDGGHWWWREGREPTHLGNASEPFDIESIDVVELPNPPFSFVAMFKAANNTKGA